MRHGVSLLPKNLTVNRDSEVRMTLASAAPTAVCPTCCSKSATAPGPTALNASRAHALPLRHPGHKLPTAAQPAAALAAVPAALLVAAPPAKAATADARAHPE